MTTLEVLLSLYALGITFWYVKLVFIAIRLKACLVEGCTLITEMLGPSALKNTQYLNNLRRIGVPDTTLQRIMDGKSNTKPWQPPC